jgi:hypothetical protein
VHHLVSRFDDHCWVHPVEVLGFRIGHAELGELLASLQYEYIQQAVAEHAVFGDRLDIVREWVGMRGVAVGLLTDFPDAVPGGIATPEDLIADAFRRAGVYFSEEDWVAINTAIRDAGRHD